MQISEDSSQQSESIMNRAVRVAFDKCIPLYASIEITLKCNFRCRHCYNFDRSKNHDPPTAKRPLDTDEILSLIDQVAEAGALYVSLTGGDALMHPQLALLVERIHQNHAMARVRTNATLLTKTICEKLPKSGATVIEVSLYGANEATYESFCNHPGGFNKTITGIKTAKELGLEVVLAIVLHKANCMDLSQMINLAEELGVKYQFSDEISSRYDGSQSSQNEAVTKEQFHQLIRGDYSQIFRCDNSAKSFQCSCARTVCGISNSGDVYPCIGAPIVAGNIRDDSFAQIWEKSPVLQRIRDLKKENFIECVKCDHQEFCNRSSGGIYINTGNYTGCDQQTLDRAKIRHEFM